MTLPFAVETGKRTSHAVHPSVNHLLATSLGNDRNGGFELERVSTILRRTPFGQFLFGEVLMRSRSIAFDSQITCIRLLAAWSFLPAMFSVALAVEPVPAKPKIEKYPDTPVWSDAEVAKNEFVGFAFLGEYVKENSAVQVTTSEGKFYLSQYHGGLPGAGWDRGTITHRWIDGADHADIRSLLSGWEKVDRSLDVTGRQPPSDAIILFDGSDTTAWNNGKMERGCLKAGTRTKQVFRDFNLYLEFLIPLKPEPPLGHPHRGNSGVFALGAYEIQIADTFGLDPEPAAWRDIPLLKPVDTWCGSVYGIQAAEVNMCLPPLRWQSMELDFTAARFRGEGDDKQKLSPAVITVIHNGVKIIDQLSLPEGTGGGPSGPRAEVAEGPIVLQNHGNPNLFRNIWIVPR